MRPGGGKRAATATGLVLGVLAVVFLVMAISAVEGHDAPVELVA
jgi:hypothetical protein